MASESLCRLEVPEEEEDLNDRVMLECDQGTKGEGYSQCPSPANKTYTPQDGEDRAPIVGNSYITTEGIGSYFTSLAANY
jgi:hypothetical protein